jgi:GH25 family lysozyme M1 (1,4-beta-N-acetylmuramidase)
MLSSTSLLSVLLVLAVVNAKLISEELSAGFFNESKTGDDASSSMGVDVSTAVSSSAINCLQSEASGSVSYIIARGFRSTGEVDYQACDTIITAYDEGIKTRDTYMFPCPLCNSTAATQFFALLSYLFATCRPQWSGKIWIDIEGSEYWTTNIDRNKDWYESLVDVCRVQAMLHPDISCGIYSSHYQWVDIFGSADYTYGNDLPLWYAHYDNIPSFDDYGTDPFGGWTSPHAKQYNGGATVCDVVVDLNYAPTF